MSEEKQPNRDLKRNSPSANPNSSLTEAQSDLKNKKNYEKKIPGISAREVKQFFEQELGVDIFGEAFKGNIQASTLKPDERKSLIENLRVCNDQLKVKSDREISFGTLIQIARVKQFSFDRLAARLGGPPPPSPTVPPVTPSTANGRDWLKKILHECRELTSYFVHIPEETLKRWFSEGKHLKNKAGQNEMAQKREFARKWASEATLAGASQAMTFDTSFGADATHKTVHELMDMYTGWVKNADGIYGTNNAAHVEQESLRLIYGAVCECVNHASLGPFPACHEKKGASLYWLKLAFDQLPDMGTPERGWFVYFFWCEAKDPPRPIQPESTPKSDSIGPS